MMKRTKFQISMALFAILLFVAWVVQQGEVGAGQARVASALPFDEKRAYRDLETVVGLGPRPAGSENLRKTQEYIVAELEAAGLEVSLYEFVATTPVGPIPMVNIGAIHPGSRSESIVVAGHYDTKRFDVSFVGANDGGSSTAVVLELARISPGLNLEHTLEFLFFDGEEAVEEWTAADSLYGSRYDIDRRFAEGTLRDLQTLILVDMVGDTDLGIVDEALSTDWLKQLIWEVAATIGSSKYFTRDRYAIEDDHIPYLKAGIPAVDLIDFDYAFWHTPEDTLDKTSASSLKIVGDVVYRALPLIDQRLARR